MIKDLLYELCIAVLGGTILFVVLYLLAIGLGLL